MYQLALQSLQHLAQAVALAHGSTVMTAPMMVKLLKHRTSTAPLVLRQPAKKLPVTGMPLRPESH